MRSNPSAPTEKRLRQHRLANSGRFSWKGAILSFSMRIKSLAPACSLIKGKDVLFVTVKLKIPVSVFRCGSSKRPLFAYESVSDMVSEKPLSLGGSARSTALIL